MNKEYDFLVFIGRMQPPTVAHCSIIEQALLKSNKVIVVLGSCNSARTLRNPFTYDERVLMLRRCMTNSQNEQIITVPMDDYTYNDEMWVVKLHETVNRAILENIPGNSQYCYNNGMINQRVGLIGHAKDNTSYYLNLFPEWGSENVRNIPGVDATSLRDAFFAQGMQSVNDKLVRPGVREFLEDFIQTLAYINLREEREFVAKYKKAWEAAPYPPTFVTVDAVVVQSGHVLLVKRGANPGKGMWAMPGGFLDPLETLEQGAMRELREETKLKVPEPVLRGSIVARETYDHPHRSSRGRTITTAFLIHLKPAAKLPKVKGSDDAAEADWVRIADLDPRTLFEDHYHVIMNLVRRI